MQDKVEIRLKNISGIPYNFSLPRIGEDFLIKITVNGNQLSDEEAVNYISELNKDNLPDFSLNQHDGRFLTSAFQKNSPYGSTSSSTHSSQLISYTPPPNFSTQQEQHELFVALCDLYQHHMLQSAEQIAVELLTPDLSSTHYYKLSNKLGNRALRRKWTELNARGGIIANLDTAFNRISLGCQAVTTFEKYASQKLEGRAEGGLSAIEGVTTIMETGVELSASYGASYLVGVAFEAMPLPFPIKIFGILATNYITGEYWDKYWDKAWGFFKNGINEAYNNLSSINSLHGAPDIPIPYHVMREILPSTFQQWEETNLEHSADIKLLTWEEQGATSNLESVPEQNRLENYCFLPNQYKIELTESRNSSFLFADFTFDSDVSDLDSISKRTEKLKTIQEKIKIDINIFRQNRSLDYRFNVPPEFFDAENENTYQPGERGSFTLSNNGGHVHWNLQVDVFKNHPLVSIALVGLPFIIDSIKWLMMEESQKAMENFYSDRQKLIAAQNKDWTSFPIAWNRFIRSKSYDQIIRRYQNALRKDIQNVIELHNTEPEIVDQFRLCHYSLEKLGHVESKASESPHEIFKDYQNDFAYLLFQFTDSLDKKNFQVAQQSIDGLLKFYPYHAGTYLAQAKFYIEKLDFVQSDKAIKKFELLANSELKQAENRKDDWAFANGQYCNIKNNFIEITKNQRQQVEEIKFYSLWKKYQSAPIQQKQIELGNLQKFSHEQFKTQPENIAVRKQLVAVLLVDDQDSQRYIKALPHQEWICNKISYEPSELKTLANLYEITDNLDQAINTYQRCLKSSCQQNSAYYEDQHRLRDLCLENASRLSQKNDVAFEGRQQECLDLAYQQTERLTNNSSACEPNDWFF